MSLEQKKIKNQPSNDHLCNKYKKDKFYNMRNNNDFQKDYKLKNLKISYHNIMEANNCPSNFIQLNESKGILKKKRQYEYCTLTGK